jgi:hypothetical protein
MESHPLRESSSPTAHTENCPNQGPPMVSQKSHTVNSSTLQARPSVPTKLLHAEQTQSPMLTWLGDNETSLKPPDPNGMVQPSWTQRPQNSTLGSAPRRVEQDAGLRPSWPWEAELGGHRAQGCHPGLRPGEESEESRQDKRGR